jgi:hypothetical protein
LGTRYVFRVDGTRYFCESGELCGFGRANAPLRYDPRDPSRCEVPHMAGRVGAATVIEVALSSTVLAIGLYCLARGLLGRPLRRRT